MGLESIIDIFNFDLVFASMMQAGSSIRGFLGNMIVYYPRFLGVYIGLVVLVALVRSMTQKKIIDVKKGFYHELDKTFFKFSLMIHKHKTTIHDFEQTVALVYQNKQDIITSSQKNFLSDLDMYKHDVGYLEKLLQVDIVKQEQRDTLSSLRGFVYRSNAMYMICSSLLGVLTVGLSYVLLSGNQKTI